MEDTYLYNTFDADGKQVKVSMFNETSMLAEAVSGLSPEAMFIFIEQSKLPSDRLESIFDRSLKTFSNYRSRAQRLDPSTSEKLILMQTLFHWGRMVFGTNEVVVQWLMMPAFGFDNRKPIDLLETVTGTNLVIEELRRIVYGDLA